MIRVIEEFLNICHFNMMNKLIDGVFVKATIKMLNIRSIVDNKWLDYTNRTNNFKLRCESAAKCIVKDKESR